MRVGLYGGSFDPPHVLHRTIVETCRVQFGLHRVIVLPAGHHPFKGDVHHAPAPARLALCRLAFVDLPWVEVDDREMAQRGISYTVDTLRGFRAALGTDTQLYFLVGADNVRELPQWRDHHTALGLAQFVAVPRAGAAVDAAALAGLDLTDAEKEGLLAHVATVAPSPLSSTEVRRRLRAHEDVRDLIHPAVLREIERRGLYRS